MQISNVPVTVHHRVSLSAPPYQLWIQGTLREELGIKDDGRVHVEIIGGEVVVSPRSTVGHADVLGDVRTSMAHAEHSDSGSSRQLARNADRHSEQSEVVPLSSLVVLDEQIYTEARQAGARFLVPRQTSPAAVAAGRWNGHVLVHVPCYLFADQGPQRLVATFASEPGSRFAISMVTRFWKFAETIALPEPYAIEFPTDEWEAWDED